MKLIQNSSIHLQLPGKSQTFISSLTHRNGNVVHDHRKKCDIHISYFNNLFSVNNNYNDFMTIINNILTLCF